MKAQRLSIKESGFRLKLLLTLASTLIRYHNSHGVIWHQTFYIPSKNSLVYFSRKLKMETVLGSCLDKETD